MTQTKLFDIMELYGSKGSAPVDLSDFTCWRVGKGARKQSTPQYGANMPHAVTRNCMIVVLLLLTADSSPRVLAWGLACMLLSYNSHFWRQHKDMAPNQHLLLHLLRPTHHLQLLVELR